MDSSWISILFYRALDHVNPAIKKWSILNFLTDKKFAPPANIKNVDSSADIAISEEFFFTKLAPVLSFSPLYRGPGSREIYTFYSNLIHKISERYISKNKIQKCGHFWNRYVEFIFEEASKSNIAENRVENQKSKGKGAKESETVDYDQEEEKSDRMNASGIFLFIHGLSNLKLNFAVLESKSLTEFGLIIRNRLSHM
jgi:hypothetical protein